MILKGKRSLHFSMGLFAVLALATSAEAAPQKKTTVKRTTTTGVAASPTPMATPEAAVPVAEATPVATPEPVPSATPYVERSVETTTVASSSERTVLLGPVVTALAVPRPFSAGLEMKIANVIGLSGSYGFLPELTISDVKLKLNGWDARVKVYPFQGAFFIGLAYGKQTFTGSQTRTINGQVVTGTVDQDNNFLTPHIGWNWGATSPGFFIGLDLGVQLSNKRTTNFNSDASLAVQGTTEYQDLRKDILDKAETVGKTPLPLISLIKFGYLF